MMNDFEKNQLDEQIKANELNETEAEEVAGGQKVECCLDFIKHYGKDPDYKWGKR